MKKNTPSDVTFTISGRVRIAQTWTARSAEIKDYKVRRKRNRIMRDIAREWTAGRGYRIATPRQMRTDYRALFLSVPGAPDNDRLFIWAIHYNEFRKELQFTAI